MQGNNISKTANHEDEWISGKLTSAVGGNE
jgi:hypothetical protein